MEDHNADDHIGYDYSRSRVMIGVRPIATIVIDMRFALKTRVVPMDHVLGGGADPPRGRGNFGGCFLIESPLYQRQRQKHVG